MREEKKGISQQRGTDSWHRYKIASPTVPQSSLQFFHLFKHFLNDPVSAFILPHYLRVQSSAELQKWERWKKLLEVGTVN